MTTVIVEDGSIVADANSYISVADADTYFASRLNATYWTSATTDNKAIAVIMASRTINRMYQFNGKLVDDTQAMQWPRYECHNPDSDGGRPGVNTLYGDVFSQDIVPQIVIDATCELALQLLTADRTGDAQGIGISRFKLEDAFEVVFDKADKLPLIPDNVQAMLSKVGVYLKARAAVVKLIRA